MAMYACMHGLRKVADDTTIDTTSMKPNTTTNTKYEKYDDTKKATNPQ